MLSSKTLSVAATLLASLSTINASAIPFNTNTARQVLSEWSVQFFPSPDCVLPADRHSTEIFSDGDLACSVVPSFYDLDWNKVHTEAQSFRWKPIDGFELKIYPEGKDACGAVPVIASAVEGCTNSSVGWWTVAEVSK